MICTIAAGATTAFCAENAAPDSADTTKACCDNSNSCCNNQADDECWLDIETITIEAANGDPIAQYTIAWLTDTGTNNVPQDTAKAEEMYAKALPGLEKAAAEGDPNACCALAKMYATGKGVAKDEAKAKELMQRYCELEKAQKKADKTTDPAPTDNQ